MGETGCLWSAQTVIILVSACTGAQCPDWDAKHASLLIESDRNTLLIICVKSSVRK